MQISSHRSDCPLWHCFYSLWALLCKASSTSLPLPVLILRDRIMNILLQVPFRRLQGVDLRSFSKVGPKEAPRGQQFLLTTNSTSIQILTQDHETLSQDSNCKSIFTTPLLEIKTQNGWVTVVSGRAWMTSYRMEQRIKSWTSQKRIKTWHLHINHSRIWLILQILIILPESTRNKIVNVSFPSRFRDHAVRTPAELAAHQQNRLSFWFFCFNFLCIYFQWHVNKGNFSSLF